MFAYILKRCLLMLPTLLGVLLLTFVVLQFVPGGPVEQYLAEAKAARHTRLFPNLPNSTGLGYGRGLSRQFSDYAHKHLPELESGVAFHSFRHTLGSSLYAAGVQERVIEAITGHKTEKGSVLADFYIKHTLPARVAALAQFVPDVTLPKYRAGQFAGALARSATKTPEKKIAKPAA